MDINHTLAFCLGGFISLAFIGIVVYAIYTYIKFRRAKSFGDNVGFVFRLWAIMVAISGTIGLTIAVLVVWVVYHFVSKYW